MSKSLIRVLYDEQIMSGALSEVKSESKVCLDAIHEFREILPEKLRKKFDKLTDTFTDSEAATSRSAYEQGFKDALTFQMNAKINNYIISILNFLFSIRKQEVAAK